MSEQSVFSIAAEQGLPGGNATHEAPLATVGQQLRAAREARGISVADAAQSLKLGPRQVAALESEDWSSLPGNTMIRGFVRNYARLLNLDGDALMRGLDAEQMQRTLQLEVSAGTSASLPQAGRRAERRDYLAIFGGLLLLLLAVLAYLFVPPGFWDEKLAALTGSSNLPAPAAPPVVAAPPAAPIETQPVLAPPGPSAAAAPANPAGAVVQSPGGQSQGAATIDTPPAAVGDTLRLRFAEAAWIEVLDGRGEVLSTGFKPAGSQQDITGQPPFSLVLGNARHVTVEYKGKTIDLESHTSKGVARLTVK
ncbi:helix-turn-helix domain-containing protein [Accumulibacter sp.]|uniref:helix-turn-helix domain-containing protein n=1 Tax=Accumulibacter sp. TaxID=2053492 RepID=UPI00260D07CB|nr:helix-turn-helix domain-containing protein [Accumulibacter sp.]